MKLLLLFINEYQLKGDSLSETFICEKAQDIYGDLVRKTIGANSKHLDIKVDRRWFEKCKKEMEFTVYLTRRGGKFKQERGSEVYETN